MIKSIIRFYDHFKPDLAIGRETLTYEKTMHYTVEKISEDLAEQLCRQITADLPEYFGLPECNEHYAMGVRARDNFALKLGANYLGLLSLEFPYPKNGSIYWMGVLRLYHNRGIGQMLMDAASRYASDLGAITMTVETLAPDEFDENYLNTYRFYEGQGFKPLFNLKPAGYEWNMVYMAKELNHILPISSVDAIKIRAIRESDIPVIVREFARFQWPKPASTFETYCKEQNQQERLTWLVFYQGDFAGYVTLKWNSFYQPFSDLKIPEIMDLNVLPPYQKKGIGSALLDLAETEASNKGTVVGIGVGLYSGYGNAQKLYIARGYQPDGLGITYDYKPVEPGNMVCLDDDLVLWFTKKVR